VLFTQFKTGEIDITGIQGIRWICTRGQDPAPHHAPRQSGTTYDCIAPNFLLPMFQDKRVRQALHYGMDKKAIIERSSWGCARGGDVRSASVLGLQPEDQGYHKYDPEKAKKLLEEAGWKVGADESA